MESSAVLTVMLACDFCSCIASAGFVACKVGLVGRGEEVGRGEMGW